MVRVVHYIGSLEYGGSQSFVMEMYRKIDRDKLQFDFITFPNQKTEIYNEIVKLGGRVYESPQYNGKNHFIFMKWWNDFFDKHAEYNIFHCHVRSVASLCIGIAHKYGRYAIAHSHSTSNGSGFIGLIKNIMQYPVRYQADYLFACSQYAGKWMFGNNVDKRKNYKIVSNAIDAERFSYDIETRENLRRNLNIEDKVVLGHIGRFTKPKNHQFLLKIIYEMCKIRKDVMLLLVGDGELRKSVENKINDLGIQNNVILVGSKSNTQDYYQAMDVFLVPSFWEGLGIVVIEAQAAGLICVVSDNIPKEADVGAGLVKFLSLNEDIRNWVNVIENSIGYERKGRLAEIQRAGFDVMKNAKKMERFYLKIDQKKEKIKCI